MCMHPHLHGSSAYNSPDTATSWNGPLGAASDLPLEPPCGGVNRDRLRNDGFVLAGAREAQWAQWALSGVASWRH
ncbi:hypothetical protein N7468_000003 [Penicillium chermesinum]|uniref:Uncharacterized protein n=1 Tax=Penicillium chermesinum TaxID=63820 RepID=A0A9W9PJG0_9EURO|nr:uncharacterized protein N7468_000003 [Penicillium chermesinum]KAJ5248552.1 hypothetical protein N7468_000003 [Penicillium chermesinum]